MLQCNKKQCEQHWLTIILICGFVLRMGLAVVTEGYTYDVNCFFAWGLRMAEVGASGFHVDGYFCDYPPAYLYVLGFVGHVMNFLQIHFEEKAARALLVFIPVFADIAMAMIAYRVACKGKAAKHALRFAAFVSFCPVLLYNTAVWKQMDSVFILCMLVSFLWLAKKNYLPSAAMYGLALAIKPQALLLGPVLAIAFLLPFLDATTMRMRLQVFKNGILGALCALAPVYICGLPFWGFGGTVSALLEKYITTTTSYPYATINAFNFMAACGGNWVLANTPMASTVLGLPVTLPFTWEQFGMMNILLLTIVAGWLSIRAKKQNCFSPVLLGAFYLIGVFTFAHCMHERYLILGVVLLLCAAALFANRRLLLLCAGFSLTSLFNLAAVLSVLDSDDNFLTSASSTLFMRGVGLATTILFLLFVAEVWRICSGESRVSFVPNNCKEEAIFQSGVQEEALHSDVEESLCEKQCDSASENVPYYVPKPQLKWQKAEWIFLACVALGIAIISFAQLGDTKAPETPLITGIGGQYTETVMVQGEASSLWYYTGVVQNGAELVVQDALTGEELFRTELAIGGLFQWYAQDIAAATAYTVTVHNAEMMEIAWKDAQGTCLPVQASGQDVIAIQGTPNGMDTRDNGFGAPDTLSAMFDEQADVPQAISYRNSFYFDEIYHARTAYESLHGLEIYETTHPPLGKNFMALGIFLFGMNGFGWRISGALFGVLMVPLFYCFVRRLSRAPLVTGFATLLLCTDFMRFTQSRIATIDTYAAFFVLLSATCMVWYCQSVLEKGVRASILPMTLSGLAFGLGAASKWTGLYAGVGLAVLYFGVLYLRCRQTVAHNARLSEIQDDVAALTTCKQDCVIAILGGFAFFVFVPLAIYLTSYWSYKGANPSFGLAEWWGNQTYMYGYHSGLEATHPFASTWYMWLFDLRPVWYYMGGHLPEGIHASIAGFFNPVVAWVGIAAFLRLCARAVCGKGRCAERVLIVFFLSQFLPWMLVTRCTFLYHYFPSFAFVIAAIALWLQDILAEKEERAYALGSFILMMSILAFIAFYPILSGMAIPALWARMLQLLPSWGFYIF